LRRPKIRNERLIFAGANMCITCNLSGKSEEEQDEFITLLARGTAILAVEPTGILPVESPRQARSPPGPTGSP
jgi:hypothetical protein